MVVHYLVDRFDQKNNDGRRQRGINMIWNFPSSALGNETAQEFFLRISLSHRILHFAEKRDTLT